MRWVLEHPLARQIADELQANPRSRWLLGGGGLLLLVLIFSQASQFTGSMRDELAKKDRLAQSLENTSHEMDWVARRAAVDRLAAQLESRLWPLETDGLATAEFQDWISHVARDNNLKVLEIRPEIDSNAANAAGLRKMSALISGQFEPAALERFLGQVAVHNRMIAVERLRITSQPVSRFELILVTWLAASSAKAKPSSPAP